MPENRPTILYILHNYFNRAGTEMHTQLLAKRLCNDFRIFAAFPGEGAINLLEFETQKLVRFPADQVAWPLTPYNAKRSEASLEAIKQQVRPDLVHVQHFIYWPLSVLDQALSWGIPALMSHHDYYAITPHFTMELVNDPAETLSADYCRKVFQADITKYLLKRREVIRNSLSRFAVHISPSKYLAGELNRIFEIKFNIIEHGIEPFEAGVREKNSNDMLRFGYIGSLLPQKGWLSLIEAFCKLKQAGAAAELIIFGGTLPEPHSKLPGIRGLGVYEQRDLPQILAQIDVGIIPSLFRETFSLVLSEFWMGGVPVAASRIGALADRISDGVNGKLFMPGDVTSITETLSWFLSDQTWQSWKLPRPRDVGEMATEYKALYRAQLTT